MLICALSSSTFFFSDFFFLFSAESSCTFVVSFPADKKDILVHEAFALFETARTDVKVVHKEDDRQRRKQFDVALQTMATQATRKLRLAAGKFGKALA